MNSPYLVIDRSGNAVDINRRIDTMYHNPDPWNQKKAEVLEMYLQGKSPAIISGLTGVPRIRIERELNRMTERRPELLSTHLAAQYPSRRKLLTDVDPAVVLEAI